MGCCHCHHILCWRGETQDRKKDGMVERKVERKKCGKESREEGLVAAAVLVKGLLLLSL